VDFITHLEPDQIFVFGSNESGIHGAGAAQHALQWGAKRGVGFGRSGQTYAIPTREFYNGRLRTLDRDRIRNYVIGFLDYAQTHADLEFLVTPIGCGYAGYIADDIAPMFDGAPPNVKLPPEFLKYLNERRGRSGGTAG
jgi:hypothetical protein